MKRFPFVATVRRVVTDTVVLSVNARSLREATDKAQQALERFPAPHDVPGVNHMYIENRENEAGDILTLEEMKEHTVA